MNQSRLANLLLAFSFINVLLDTYTRQSGWHHAVTWVLFLTQMVFAYLIARSADREKAAPSLHISGSQVTLTGGLGGGPR